MRARSKPQFKTPEILWRPHDGDSVRVWREDWFADEFEIVSKDAFEKDIRPMLRHLGLTVNEADD